MSESLLQKIEAAVLWENRTGIDLVIHQQILNDDHKVTAIKFVIERKERMSEGGIVLPSL